VNEVHYNCWQLNRKKAGRKNSLNTFKIIEYILQRSVVQVVRFLRVELAYSVSSPQLNIGFCIFLDLFHAFESSTQH
jgi:hypothetical protein